MFSKAKLFWIDNPKPYNGPGPGSCWAEREHYPPRMRGGVIDLQANQWLNLQKKAYRKLLSEWTDLAYSMTKYSVFSVSITWNNFTMLGWSTVFIIRTSRNSFCKLPGFNWVLSMILIATCKKNAMETFHTKKPWFLTSASIEIPNFFINPPSTWLIGWPDFNEGACACIFSNCTHLI